jgi:hypothetical protein
MNYLRNFCILFLIIFLSACMSLKDKHPFIPLEYSLSEEEKVKGKTLIYEDKVTGERSYTDVFYKISGGKNLLILRAYTDSLISDSTVELDHKLYESYSGFFNHRLNKAQIFLDTIIENGKKLGKYKLGVILKTDSAEITVRSEFEYIKDTSFVWKRKEVPALVIQAKYNFTLKDQDTDRPVNFIIEYLTYEAKGIGTIRMKVYNIKEQRTKNIDLIEIRDKTNN